MKIAIVVSKFNLSITEALLAHAVEYFNQHRSEKDTQETYWVPGAVEIPLAAQLLAKKGGYSAIICLGAVIHGETDHYDYVCQQVSYGCQRVALDFDIPIIFGVLTTQNLAQAQARCDGSHNDRGREAMQAALEMVKEIANMSF